MRHIEDIRTLEGKFENLEVGDVLLPVKLNAWLRDGLPRPLPASAVVKHINGHGVASVEFRWDSMYGHTPLYMSSFSVRDIYADDVWMMNLSKGGQLVTVI